MGVVTDGPNVRNMGIQVESVLMLNSACQCDPEMLEKEERRHESRRRDGRKHIDMDEEVDEDYYYGHQDDPQYEEIESIDGDGGNVELVAGRAVNTMRRDVTVLEAEMMAERERLREIYESEAQAILAKISQQLDAVRVDKGDIEKQLGEILNELQRYKSEHSALSTRYEQNFEGINEQIGLIKVKTNFGLDIFVLINKRKKLIILNNFLVILNYSPIIILI